MRCYPGYAVAFRRAPRQRRRQRHESAQKANRNKASRRVVVLATDGRVAAGNCADRKAVAEPRCASVCMASKRRSIKGLPMPKRLAAAAVDAGQGQDCP